MIDHSQAIEEAKLGGTLLMLIAGEARLAVEGDTLESFDPATGEAIARFPNARQADVDMAVEAARGAFDEGPWYHDWGPYKRAKCLQALAGLCREHEKDLARVEALDMGMAFGFARKFSAKSLVRNLEYYAGWADKMYGEIIPGAANDVFQYTRREPYGVVGAIYPWNAPLMFVGAKLGPALAAGNVVILKPSELGCLSTLRFATLVKEAGFPDGVIQVVTGDGETGRCLVQHPRVDKLSFTGGRHTARLVQKAAAEPLTPVLFELGGKSPNIIFADADLSKATMLSTMGVFGLSGQACAAGTRLLVERSVYQQVVDGICAFAKGLPLGDPMGRMTMLGPLVSASQKARVLAAIEQGVAEGATLATKVDVPSKLGDAGHFVGPHVFTDVTPEMALWREEIFGPVLCITAFDTEKEAITLANQTEYGLAAGVWTQDRDRADRMVRRLDAGLVWVNTYGSLPVSVPFGGFKQSGWGKEGGRDALASYSRVKSVVMQGT